MYATHAIHSSISFVVARVNDSFPASSAFKAHCYFTRRLLKPTASQPRRSNETATCGNDKVSYLEDKHEERCPPEHREPETAIVSQQGQRAVFLQATHKNRRMTETKAGTRQNLQW